MEKDKTLIIRSAPLQSRPELSPSKALNQLVRIKYKGREHTGRIIEHRMDKYKINILDLQDHKIVIKTDWFESRDFKRTWQ